jgi:hypothetical protein
MQRGRVLSAYVSIMALAGCLEPYSASELKDSVDLLVVDGFVNTTDSIASVRLTRTIPMDTSASAASVANAAVSIESDGHTYDLVYQGDGTYVLKNTFFDPAQQYRVTISTGPGKRYQSDFVEVTDTPAIDSITWKPALAGIDLFVNTHDVTGGSRYYSWNFDVTWEYVASFVSSYKLIDGAYFPRYGSDQIYRCWNRDRSDEILVATSTALSEDVIRDFFLTNVPVFSNRLNFRYSILVTQRTLTKEAYTFWNELRKTTETVGGLFDPQPYKILGNVHGAEDATEEVLGYFSAGSVTRQRLFVTFNQLPGELRRLRSPLPCGEERVSFIPIEEIPTTPNSVYLIDPVSVPGQGITGFTTADAACVDCRVFGGTTAKPEFWP